MFSGVLGLYRKIIVTELALVLARTGHLRLSVGGGDVFSEEILSNGFGGGLSGHGQKVKHHGVLIAGSIPEGVGKCLANRDELFAQPTDPFPERAPLPVGVSDLQGKCFDFVPSRVLFLEVTAYFDNNGFQSVVRLIVDKKRWQSVFCAVWI